MEKETEVSIIIVSFNTIKVLDECIHSIYKSNLRFSYEIIVIDNASKDESVEMLRKKYSEITVIENKTNKLFAKANNQGAHIAKGKYLLLLNSDTIVEKDNLEKLIMFLTISSDKIACVGPTVLNQDKTLQSSGYALPSISERVTMVFHLNHLVPKWIGRLILPIGTPNLYDSNHKVGWISGCCILIRKEVYLQVGGLNEELQFYGEEPELGWKLKKFGYETWVISDSSIVHLGGQSTKNDSTNFLKDTEGKLYRYSQLQKFTVGYSKAIYMSKIVILSSQIKKNLSGSRVKKDYFNNTIEYEEKVVEYLARCIKGNK